MIQEYSNLSDNINSENEFESIDGAIKLNQNILEKFAEYDDIEFAYPTQRFYNNSIEGKSKP